MTSSVCFFRFLSSTSCRCSALRLVANLRASNSYTSRDRTSEEKTIFICKNCTNMTDACCENPSSEIPCYVSQIFLIALILLFTFGGVFYYQQRPKEISYGKDLCLVLTQGYRNRTCQAKGFVYPCFSAAWGVRLNKNASINATAESIRRYSSINGALAMKDKYQVWRCEVLR